MDWYIWSVVTTALDHDNSVIRELFRDDDRAIFDDQGYASDQTKRAAQQAHVYWAVLDKANRNRKLSGSQCKRNKKHALVRAKVEHVFCVVKCQFSYRKTRYKGLAKNASQVFSLIALANLCIKPGDNYWLWRVNCARDAPKQARWANLGE